MPNEPDNPNQPDTDRMRDLIRAARRQVGQAQQTMGVTTQPEAGDGSKNKDGTTPDPHAASDWAAGFEPLPGYRLVERLGRGGFGEVWRADGPGRVPLALKRVDLQTKFGETELAALELLKKVRHPHLLSLHGYWVTDGLLIIGYELADESLQNLLQRCLKQNMRGLSAAEVIRYLTDAAEALDYLNRPIHSVNSHEVRILHRDVKPANLLLQGGALKVADFGLAKALENVVEPHTGSMTVHYAPPEFFQGLTSANSDQYSLGVTYYQLRTGRLPFEGSPHEIIQARLHATPALDGLEDAERRIVARALARDPEQRWAGCVKFIGEVQRALAPLMITSGGGTLIKVNDSDAPMETGAVRKYHGQPVTTGVLFTAGEFVPLPLKKTAVRAAITAASAEVTVDQLFVNAHNRAVEAVYVFPLPEDAAVHRLRMHIGDRTIEGVVREKVEARRTYEEAKKEGHGAALLEESTPNLFTISVANILPGQEVRVEMAYLQPLPFQAGQYRFVFPMVVSPRYVLGTSETAEPIVTAVPDAVHAPRLPQGVIRGDAVSLEIDLDAGVPLCGFDSPSHDISILEEDGQSRVRIALRNENEIPNRDFVLNYRVAGPEINNVLFYEPGEGDEPGTFALLATPPGEEMAVALPREVVFVLDRSGSMGGRPLEEAKKALMQLLDRLGPQDAFNVIAFDDKVEVLAAAPLRAEEPALRRARAFVEGIQSRGGTEMLEPLRLALRQPAADATPRLRTVIFLTDGSVSGERELLAALRNDIGPARIIGFGIGTAVNRHLLNQLTAAGRGFAEFIYPGENIARAVDRTLARLSRPVLTDIGLEWAAEGVELIHDRCPDLYRDQPLFVIGRYRGAQPPAVTVRGRLAERPYAARIETAQARRHAGGVPLRALLARRRIAALLDEMWERPERKVELRRQVIELAIRFRLASEFTSFLAVEYRSAAEREQALQATKVEVPQYMPEGMAGAPSFAKMLPAAAARPAVSLASPAADIADALLDCVDLSPPRDRASHKSVAGFLKSLFGKGADGGERLSRLDRAGGATPPGTPGQMDDSSQAKLDAPLRGLAEKVAKKGKKGNFKIDSTQHVVDYKVEVLIRLADTAPGTLAALAALGFVQTRASQGDGSLVGMIDVRKLEALAKLDAVLLVTLAPPA